MHILFLKYKFPMLASLVMFFIVSASAPAVAKSVRVTGERITLGDVVGNVPADLQMLDVGPAPALGRHISLSGRRIRQRLKQAMISAAGLRIPRMVKINRAQQVLNELQLAALLTQKLPSLIPPKFRHKAQIESVSVPGGIRLPVGALTLDATFPRFLRAGVQSIPVRIHITGNKKIYRVNARVQIAMEGGQVNSRYSQVHDIRRGDVVQVFVNSGPVKVRASAIAQRGGSIGDMIPILPQGGRRLIQARITSNKQVEVPL